MMHYILAAVPSQIAGMPSWVLNGLSIGSLVSLIIMGLVTSRLWTKSQVDLIRADHTKAIDDLNKVHDREVKDAKERYELHITRTVDQYRDRVTEAVTREKEWQDVARRWQAVAEMLSAGVEPMQEQSAASLAILQAWQSASQRPGKRT